MSNLSLYQITENYLNALDFLTDPEADFPLEAITDTLEGLDAEISDKAINVAKFFRNMEASAEAMKQAEQTMAKRRKAIEKRAAVMREYLKINMEASGLHKIECAHFCLSVRNNPASVVLTDEAEIPSEFKKQEIVIKVDKTAIKKALKDGQTVSGAALQQGTRLAIH